MQINENFLVGSNKKCQRLSKIVMHSPQTHPCNENRVFLWVVFLTGKNLFSSPGNPVMKTGFSLCGKTTQGKPCSGPVLALYGIAVLWMIFMKTIQVPLIYKSFITFGQNSSKTSTVLFCKGSRPRETILRNQIHHNAITSNHYSKSNKSASINHLVELWQDKRLLQIGSPISLAPKMFHDF